MRSNHMAILRCALAIVLCVVFTTRAVADPPRAATTEDANPDVAVEKSLVRYRTRHIAALQLVQNLERLGLFNPRELRITIDDGRQEITAYGPADEHAKFEKAIEMLDVDHPEEQNGKVQAKGQRIHVVPIGELTIDVLKTITSIYQSEFKFLTFHDGLMIAEGAAKDIDAIVELVERIERAHNHTESRERDKHHSDEPGDSISLRVLCLLENGNSELSPLEEPLATELAKLGFGQTAKATELRTTTTLNDKASKEEFGVGGQIGDGQLQAEFRLLDLDGPENLILMAEVAMTHGYGNEKSAIFQTKTLVQLPLGEWAVVAAVLAPESKAGSNGISPPQLILLLRADPMPLIKTK